MSANRFVRPILLAAFIFAGCEAYPPPPPVTAAMTKTHGKKRVSQEQLEQGRKLYVGRCIECHTLPNISYYSDKEWPRIINWMGHKSHLSDQEREAVLAYILAARK